AVRIPPQATAADARARSPWPRRPGAVCPRSDAARRRDILRAKACSTLPNSPPAEPAPDDCAGSSPLRLPLRPFVSSRRIAELRLKAPVRAEGNEPLSLLPLIPAQNLLHRTLQVVVAQPPKHPAEELKRELVCFQKRLLGGVIVGAMRRSASRHRAHREAIHLAQ